MIRQTLINECVRYFKSNKGFERMFLKLKDKYCAIGRIGGTVILQNPTAQEKDALTGFLKRDCSKQSSLTVSAENIQKSLDNTRFSGIFLEEVLIGYFDEALVTNREAQVEYERVRSCFFDEFVVRYLNTPAYDWLSDVLINKINAYKSLIQRYDADKQGLGTDIHVVCEAMNHLPCANNEKLRLPVFASRITKNPHSFDEDTGSGQLLLYALTHMFDIEKPRNAEEKAELYYAAGILIDDVSNQVLCFGLKAYTEYGLHQGWEGFFSRGEPIQATLANLSRLKSAVSLSTKVFVVENPGVFTAIMERVPLDYLVLVCTYGQLKLASLVLLDLLVKEGVTVYYSGDFDPEGLLIADRLKCRYGNALCLWRYSQEDYANVLSGQAISSMRIKKMEQIKDGELAKLAHQIRKEGYAGYQELLIEKLVRDITELTAVEKIIC